MREGDHGFDLDGMSSEPAAAPAASEVAPAPEDAPRVPMLDRQTPTQRWWFGFDRWFSNAGDDEFVLA